jgi:hypothetical protein
MIHFSGIEKYHQRNNLNENQNISNKWSIMMKVIPKSSIIVELDNMINEYGGPNNIDRINISSDEYEELLTALGESDVTEYKGISIQVSPELLKG